MSKITALNDEQRRLAGVNTDIVRWVIYDYIKANENIYGLSSEDLFQEGCICLCNAAATYDGERAKFRTYARVVVKNGLLTYCKKMNLKHKAANVDELPWDSGDNGNDDAEYAANDENEMLLSEVAVFGLLESVKPEYNGIVLLGIEALELKVKGFTGAEIAEMYGVEQNHVGAWITRAKRKLLQNERFVTGLKAL